MSENHQFPRSRPARIGLAIAAAVGLLAAPASADESCAPTPSDHPLRLLVDRINDPDLGFDLPAPQFV